MKHEEPKKHDFSTENDFLDRKSSMRLHSKLQSKQTFVSQPTQEKSYLRSRTMSQHANKSKDKPKFHKIILSLEQRLSELEFYNKQIFRRMKELEV